MTPAIIKSRIDLLLEQYRCFGDGIFGLRSSNIEKLESFSSIIDACLYIDPTGERWPSSSDEISEMARIIGADRGMVTEGLKEILTICNELDALIAESGR